MSFPALKEAREKHAAKLTIVGKVLEEAGPDRDFGKVKSLDGADTKAKLDQLGGLNAELAELLADVKRLEVVEAAAQAVAIAEGNGKGEAGAEQPTKPAETKDFADLFLESDAYKGRPRGGSGNGPSSELPVKGLLHARNWYGEARTAEETKTLMTLTAGFAADDPRLPLVVPIAQRPVELVDLIPKFGTTVPVITWMEQTTRTNTAAETAEGGQKPEATIVYTERTNNVRKIAVTLPVTTEQLDDVPQIRAILELDLSQMLRQRLSDQIASGDGTAPNLRGILNTSGIQTQAKGADPTPDAVYKAMVLVMTTGQATPDAFVTNPLDWQDVRLLRTADGLYIWGNPSDAGPQTIWGLRVVLAQGMTQNTGVVGDFQDFSRMAVRQNVTVDSGYVNDDFLKNRLTLRAEMRVALMFIRPAAFCSVTGI